MLISKGQQVIQIQLNYGRLVMGNVKTQEAGNLLDINTALDAVVSVCILQQCFSMFKRQFPLEDLDSIEKSKEYLNNTLENSFKETTNSVKIEKRITRNYKLISVSPFFQELTNEELC